jgi:hypothetical protein
VTRDFIFSLFWNYLGGIKTERPFGVAEGPLCLLQHIQRVVVLWGSKMNRGAVSKDETSRATSFLRWVISGISAREKKLVGLSNLAGRFNWQALPRPDSPI